MYISHMAMKIILKNMCVVTRVAIGFQAGYHHVKLNAENKITEEYIYVKIHLLKIHYRNTSDYYEGPQ